MSSYEYLLSDISTIKGIGTKIGKLFRKKNINTIFDLLWNLPRDFVDRSNVYPINELQVGKIQTVTVVVKKYNFPRIRNLPNKVICEDETGKLDCIFFNSYEGYIRKILPLNAKVTISGKIGYYNKKYQITNPTHLSEDPNSVKKIDKNYNLTEGLNNKFYNKIIQEVLKNIPNLDEWLDKEILKKFDIPLIWQLDGRPMSGDLAPTTSRDAVKLFEKIGSDLPPGLIQLAGGTNEKTHQFLESNNLPDGIAFGSAARKIMQPFIEFAHKNNKKLYEYPEKMALAIKKAKKFLEPWKSSSFK